MKLDAFVTAAIAGLNDGREDIAVGLAKVLRLESCVALGLFLDIVNKARD